MSSKLFTPLSIGRMALANRITVAPMCQYSAADGCMTDWHMMHLGSLAVSGASMLVIEATGVSPEGRITPQCVGLWSDANEAEPGCFVGFNHGDQDGADTRLGEWAGPGPSATARPRGRS